MSSQTYLQPRIRLAPPLPSFLQVLLVGRDQFLLTYREQVLQRASLRTGSTCLGIGIPHLEVPKAWVALLCHTLSAADRASILKVFEQSSQKPRVIALDSGQILPREFSSYECVLNNLSGPAALIECVRSQLHKARTPVEE